MNIDQNTDIKLNIDSFKEISFSKLDHFEYFQKLGIDKLIYRKTIEPIDCDIKNYQNMLIYSFVKDNIKPGSNILEIGNLTSPVSKILNSKGYSCWSLGFNFITTDNTKKNKNKIEWTLKDDKGKIVDYFPENFFEFSFSISAFVKIPDNERLQFAFLEKIKYLLKPLKYSLFSFLNAKNSEDVVWFNPFMEYLFENAFILNDKYSKSSILNNENLFIMSEEYFNKHWKTSDKMTYDKNGRFFAYSVLWQNNDIFKSESFQTFTFSKISHFDLFDEAGISLELFGTDAFGKVYYERNIENYKNMLFFSFLKNNLRKNSNVLIIGECENFLKEKLSDSYNLYFISDSKIITNNILKSSSKDVNKITELDGKSIDFFPNRFFDLIYSSEEYQYPKINTKEFTNIDINIYSMLSPFGKVFFSFTKYFFKRIFKKNEIIRYFFINTDKFNRFVNYKTMFADEDLFSDTKSGFNFNQKNQSVDITRICYNLLWDYKPRLPTITSSSATDSLKTNPAFIFHHLMKCGGTSVVITLYNWFNVIFEHTEAPNGLYKDMNDYHRYKLNLDYIVSDTCIVGHFQHDGYFLSQRYSEAFRRPDEFKIFTFVREPLALVISLYYYSRESIVCSLENYINGHKNFLANLFPCNENNYKEVLDKYFFIGVVEKMQESFDKLADLSGKVRIKLPYVNKSKKDDQISNLSLEFIQNFKRHNKLDYLIYDYCLEKLSKINL